MLINASVEQFSRYYSFRFTEGERLVFRQREKITVSQWAEKYRMVEAGPMRGPWRNDVTPYCVEPMDCFNVPWIRRIDLMWAPQTAKTQVLFNCLSYAADQVPGPAMYIMPDEKVAKRISRRRIRPMLRMTPRTASLLGDRLGDVTSMAINFTNGMDLMMAWATSAAELASESVQYLFCDEVDKWPDFSGKEADPMSLAEIRTNSYPHTKKIINVSSPAEDPSNIAKDIDTHCDELRRYWVPCPVCGEYQVMEFNQIKWPGQVRDAREIQRRRLAHYECVSCAMSWDDHMRDQAVKRGQWRADISVFRPRGVAFHLPSWYSPFLSLSDPAASFLRGQEDVAKLMVFVTQHKAEPWKTTIQPKKEGNVLEAHKTEIPAGIVPREVVALTCGIDMQKHGFWFVVRGWTEKLESWLIQYGYIASWADVEALVFHTSYPVLGQGNTMTIFRAALDTGGGVSEDDEWTRTEEAYQWLRNIHPGRVFGTKGSSRRQVNRVKVTTIDHLPRSNKPIPGGLELRLIDTMQFKALIHWRLERTVRCISCNHATRLPVCEKCGAETAPESQRFHLHADTGMDYVHQLLAEEMRKSRRGKAEWVRIRKANHLLDAEVLAAACADPEWLPSLKMLAAHLREKQRKAENVAIGEGADNQSRPWMHQRQNKWFRRK